MSEPNETPAPKPAPAAAAPAPAAPPARTKDEILADPLVADAVAPVLGAILDAKEAVGEITIFADVDRIVEVCRSFKNAGFTYLVDLTGVDYSKYPGHTGHRFGVTYTLYSFEKNERVRIRVRVYDTLPMPSVSSVWKTANWHERETYDMFGIVFEGHPRLERILMWEGFNGHPLRKDFPVRGIDTGARTYPEVFPEGGGPREGSTGKDVRDINMFQGQWDRYGISPGSDGGSHKMAPQLAKRIAPTATPTAAAPWHDPQMPINIRIDLAAKNGLEAKLFASMAQTDCTACGWDCEGYAGAIVTGETNELNRCIPGGKETEASLRTLLKEAGRL